MSSSSTKLVSPASSAPPSSRLLTPKTPAIPRIETPIARLYGRTHVLLVLAYYVFRFKALVANPLSTMIWDILPSALLQCVFCTVCLPTAGTWGSGGSAIIPGTASGKSGKTGSGSITGGIRRKAAKAGMGGLSTTPAVGGASWKGKVVPMVLSLILTLLLAPLPLTLLAIALGAPLYPQSLILHTLLLSVHVSLLAILPLFYTHGVSSVAWREIMAAWLPFDEAGVWGEFIGCMMGGWIGAVPMALDWDRDWQAWPIPVLTGAYIGWGLGRACTVDIMRARGRRIDMSVGSNQVDHMAAASIEGTKRKQ